jgi:glycosyltransferase involved in cell wall biosynthesis
MKIIYAVNIHSGGGKTLLDEVIDGIDSPSDYILFLNERYQLKADASQFIDVLVIKNNLLARLIVEFRLFFTKGDDKKILCFGNLPPLIIPNGFITIFLQNRYLIDFVTLNGFSWKTKVRIWLERILFFFQCRNVNQFVVQTQTMKNLLTNYIGNSKPVKILPFAQVKFTQAGECPLGNNNPDKFFSFAYPVSGEPHKNHANLIYAWIELASKGIFPTLYLTLDVAAFPGLISWISEKTCKYNLKVINIGTLDREEIHLLYSRVDALVFTSYFESFGLPLVEAKDLGLPILASELDFVRDIVNPLETFDPMSKISIARAVMRFMGNAELPVKIRNGKEFISEIFG